MVAGSGAGKERSPVGDRWRSLAGSLLLATLLLVPSPLAGAGRREAAAKLYRKGRSLAREGKDREAVRAWGRLLRSYGELIGAKGRGRTWAQIAARCRRRKIFVVVPSVDIVTRHPRGCNSRPNSDGLAIATSWSSTTNKSGIRRKTLRQAWN